MARQANRVVGHKFGSLLGGVLGGLYAGSSADVNPDYANPGDHAFNDPNFDANTVQPFKSGGGLFGGVKAKEQNVDFANTNMLSTLAAQRQLENQKALSTFNQEQANKQADYLLGQEGQATGQFLGNLPTDQLSNIIPPAQTFASPAEQQRYVVNAYGAKTPSYQLPNLASPENLNAEKGAMINKGLLDLGQAKLDPVTGKVYNNALSQTKTHRTPIMGKGEPYFDLQTQKFVTPDKVIGYNEDLIPMNTPANITNIQDRRMTPDIVQAAMEPVQPEGDFADAQLGTEVPPLTGESEYLSTDAGPDVTGGPRMRQLYPDPNRLEGLIPDLYRGGKAIIGEGVTDIGEKAKQLGVKAKPVFDAADYLRQLLIRRGAPSR
jgi:hypothetical protein